jgi:hypothetical protein
MAEIEDVNRGMALVNKPGDSVKRRVCPVCHMRDTVNDEEYILHLQTHSMARHREGCRMEDVILPTGEAAGHVCN